MRRLSWCPPTRQKVLLVSGLRPASLRLTDHMGGGTWISERRRSLRHMRALESFEVKVEMGLIVSLLGAA